MPVYDAFISYSHAKDKPIAAALQSVIQKLGKPWHKRRALRVFRDDTSLSATPQLWPSIEQALAQSRYLLLLASPEAAASPWVGKEVEYWLTHKSPDTLLIGVTDGTLTWNEKKGDFAWKPKPPLPPVLKGRFPAEPKWVDLSAYRDGADPRDARFIELGADFAAAIHGTPKEDLLSQEVRQQKRALQLAVSAAAIMLLLAVGAVAAGLVARYQADRAEKNFAAAKDTVNSLIFQITQGLRNVEGIRIESLDKILGTTRKAVEKLAATDPDNIDLLRSKAAMLDEFAQTYLAAGNLDQALKAAEEGLAIHRRLAEEDSAGALRNLSVGLVRLGDALRDRGDSAAALTAYEESRAIREKLAATAVDDPRAQLDLDLTLERIAGLKRQAGDSKGALAAYEKSLTLRRRLAEAEPQSAEPQRSVAVTLGKICDVKRDLGDTQGARAACDAALAETRELAQQNPGNTELERDVAIALEQIGGLKLAGGDSGAALSDYNESLAIRRRLATVDAKNTTWQRDLAIGLSLLGDAKHAQKDYQGAATAHEESLAILRRLADLDKNNPEWQQDISIALDKLGYARVSSGDLRGALDAFDERLAVARRVAAIDPNNVAWQRSVSIALNRIGIAKLVAGDSAGALAAYEESLSIARKIAETDRDNIMRQPDIAIVLERIGHIRAAAGDRAGALTAYEEGLGIARRMLEAYPRSTVWLADVSVTLDKIGDLKLAQDDKDGARAAYQESADLARQLAAIDGTDAVTQTDLVLRLYKLANITDGEAKQASLDEAIKIVERLDKEGKLTHDKKNWKDMLLALRNGAQAP